MVGKVRNQKERWDTTTSRKVSLMLHRYDHAFVRQKKPMHLGSTRSNLHAYLYILHFPFAPALRLPPSDPYRAALSTWLACLFVHENRYRSAQSAVDPARQRYTRVRSYIRASPGTRSMLSTSERGDRWRARRAMPSRSPLSVFSLLIRSSHFAALDRRTDGCWNDPQPRSSAQNDFSLKSVRGTLRWSDSSAFSNRADLGSAVTTLGFCAVRTQAGYKEEDAWSSSTALGDAE